VPSRTVLHFLCGFISWRSYNVTLYRTKTGTGSWAWAEITEDCGGIISIIASLRNRQEGNGMYGDEVFVSRVSA